MRILLRGVFDCFHYGHVEFLRRANIHGSVFVAVHKDSFAERYKSKPLFNEKERLRLLSVCFFTTVAFLDEGEENWSYALDQAMPDVIVRPYPNELYYTPINYPTNMRHLTIATTDGISTSEIKRRARL